MIAQPILGQCDYEHLGFIYYDQCDGVQFFLIEKFDGTIVDPYIDISFGFGIYGGQPVEFDYVMADVTSPCEGMPDAVSITCIRERFDLVEICDEFEVEFIESCTYNFDSSRYEYFIDVVAIHPDAAVQSAGFFIKDNNTGQVVTTISDTIDIGPFEKDSLISLEVSIADLPFCVRSYNGPMDMCNGSQLEMSIFRAFPLEDRNLIEWSTAIELSIDYFEVERSFDQENFEIFRTVNAVGASNTITDYQTVDLNTNRDTAYYRLKAYDFNENLYIINKVVTVIRETVLAIPELSNYRENELKVYPNPTQDYVYLSSSNATGFEVQILDTNGKLIQVKKPEFETNNEMQINIESLPNGIYFIKITDGINEQTFKVLKN